MSNLRCVTCCKLDLNCACIVYCLLLCAHAVINTGELCVVFVCGSRSSCNLFLVYMFYLRCALVSLCLNLRVTFFLLYLVRYILTSSVLIQLWVVFDSSCFEFLLHLLPLYFSYLLSFCCVSTLSSVLCRIVVHVRCLCGIHVVFVFWLVSLYHWRSDRVF